MAQQGHRGPYPNMSLVVVGENCQEKNRVGMEVQSLQVVMVEHGKEELEKGGTKPAVMALTKSGYKVLPLPSGRAEPTLSATAPSLPCTAIIWHVRARFFSDTFGGSRAGEYHAPAGVWRGAMPC